LVDIHTEKVSRKRIGALASFRKYPHTHKILPGEDPGPRAPYTRNPINFTCLDHIGHGIKDSESQLSKTGTMSRRTSSKSLTQAQGSLGRSVRIKDAVPPPLIPEKTPESSNSLVTDAVSPLLPPPDDVFGELPPPPPPAPLEISLPPLFPGEVCDLPSYPLALDMSDLPPPLDYEINVSTWLPDPIEDGPFMSPPRSHG
ncbi:ABI gene family member 3-like, partial [Discoglossus pictus]